jgi:ribosomal protein S16
MLGTFDPLVEKHGLVVDTAKVEEWIKKGAKPTNTIARLLKGQGMNGMEPFIIEMKDRKVKKGKKEEAPATADKPAAAPAAETPVAETTSDEGEAKPAEEAAPAEAPVEEVPAEEKKEEEAPVEEKKDEEKPAEEKKEEEKPSEPAKCPKCGGEMTEGHTCPVEEKEDTPQDSEDMPLDDQGGTSEATDDSTEEKKDEKAEGDTPEENK